jgi:16S rRNA processing protein RimM
MIQKFFEIGTIVCTHGLRGEVKVNPACDDPAFFRQFKTLYYDAQGQQPVRVLGVREHKHAALLTLDGVTSIHQAEPLRNQKLYFKRADACLAEGQYFIAELLGCAVVDVNTKACYGTLCDVSKTGANDVWHIQTGEGHENLIPVIDDVVKCVNIADGRVEILPLPGLFD